MTRLAEISLRTSPAGGDVGEPTARLGASVSADRFILLVHGYNVPKKEAVRTLVSAQDNLALISEGVGLDTVRVYWPGDARLPKVVRWITYPGVVRRAIHAGKELANAIATLRSPIGQDPEVIVIAHSLGCRVALEALAELSSRAGEANSGRRSVRIYLMAAAVPVDLVRWGQPLHRAVLSAERPTVLYSESDLVLRTFGLGQFLAKGEAWDIPEAVGQYGNPWVGLWHNRVPMHGFGHNLYWPSADVAKFFVKELDGKGPQDLPAHHLSRFSPPSEEIICHQLELWEWSVA